jgi:hypothetical protein
LSDVNVGLVHEPYRRDGVVTVPEVREDTIGELIEEASD